VSRVGLTGALKQKSPDAMEKNQNKLETSNVIFETTINCFFSLKPASTVFPPNCHSNSRYGVTKSLWESRITAI
jgi:hypothetical protein